MKGTSDKIERMLEHLAQRAARSAGSSWAFSIALMTIAVWAERDLQILQKHYGTLSKLASADSDITESHSVEEAERRHKSKRRDKDAA